MSSRSNGFTLLEILVVMTLLSIIVGLLGQSFSVFYKAYLQTDAIETNLIREEMVAGWFRDNLSGAIASQDSLFSFKGDSKKITFTSSDSLTGPQGEIKLINWIISSSQEGSTLSYRENNKEPNTLMVWEGAKADFLFRDRPSDWISAWPPQNSKPGLLPERVKLRIQGKVDSEIFVAINTRRLPRYDYRDWL